jgi:hypothetical protein
VEHDRRHGEVGGVAVDRSQPTAGEDLGFDAHDGLVGAANPVEEQQVDTAHQHHQERHHHEGSRLVQRVDHSRLSWTTRAIMLGSGG